MSTIDTLSRKEVDRILMRLKRLLNDHSRVSASKSARIKKAKVLRRQLEMQYRSFVRDKHPLWSEFVGMGNKDFEEYVSSLWRLSQKKEPLPPPKKVRARIVETTGPAQGFVTMCEGCGDILESEKVTPVKISNVKELLLCARCKPKKPKEPPLETKTTPISKYNVRTDKRTKER